MVLFLQLLLSPYIHRFFSKLKIYRSKADSSDPQARGLNVRNISQEGRGLCSIHHVMKERAVILTVQLLDSPSMAPRSTEMMPFSLVNKSPPCATQWFW